jgi:ankyrin repeat protein
MIKNNVHLKSIVGHTKSRVSSITAFKGRNTTGLLKRYCDNTHPTSIDVAKQLLAAFTLENRQLNSVDRTKSQVKGSQSRRKRERYKAAVRACQLNHSDILLLLIRQFHVDPNQKDNKTGATLLITSINFGHVDCVLALLSQRSLTIDQTDRWGWTALHWACTDSSRVELMERLLRNNCDKNIKEGMSGRSPLELCCQCGNEPGILTLLNSAQRGSGAGGALKVRYTVTPAKGFNLKADLPEWAMPKSAFDIRAVLLLSLATVGDLKRIEKLFEAIRRERELRLNETEASKERNKDRGPVIEFLRTPNKETSLMRCAAKRQAATLKFILEHSRQHCTYVNAESPISGSALGLACAAGCIECTNILIKYGAFVHREEIHTGLTPLMTVCKSGEFPELIRCLVNRHHVDINQVDSQDHLTALMVSAWSGHHENVIELIECDADLTLSSTAGVTALMMCCAKSLDWAVKQIIEKFNVEIENNDEDAWDDNNNSGDSEKVKSGSLLSETFLYKLLNATDEDGWNALRWACEGKAVECIDVLLGTKLINIHSSAFELNERTGTWMEPNWISPYIECVRRKIEEHLIDHNLERLVGVVPVEDLLITTKGDFNQLLELSITRAKEAIKIHEFNEKRMHRELLRDEVKFERSRRARGGEHWSVNGEVQSLFNKKSTRSSTTSVNDLAFMLLPELDMTPPKRVEGVWSTP